MGTWAVALLCFLLLGFAPILLSGLAGDLIRSVKIASYGGPFSLFTPEKALATFGSQFRTPWVVVVLLGNLGLSVLGPRGLRRVSRTWTLAMLGVLAYRPLHPVPHEYLRQPLILMSAVAVAPLVAWVAGLGGSNALRTLAILLIVSEAFRDWPSQASPRATAGVAWDLARGRVPRGPFPGGGVWFPLEHRRRGEYQWEDYLDVIDHLRKTTRPETPLANVLRRLPYPSLNGPTGRPSPFRFESGVCWMLVVDEAIDEALAEQLDQAGDAVVVWSPDEGPSFSVLWLPHVTDLIRREFRPSARFGKFEVWRRIGPVGAADLGQGRGVR